MWLMFNKVAEICVASLDKRLFFVFYYNIYEDIKNIFKIFWKKNGNFRKHI